MHIFHTAAALPNMRPGYWWRLWCDEVGPKKKKCVSLTKKIKKQTLLLFRLFFFVVVFFFFRANVWLYNCSKFYPHTFLKLTFEIQNFFLYSEKTHFSCYNGGDKMQWLYINIINAVKKYTEKKILVQAMEPPLNCNNTCNTSGIYIVWPMNLKQNFIICLLLNSVFCIYAVYMNHSSISNVAILYLNSCFFNHFILVSQTAWTKMTLLNNTAFFPPEKFMGKSHKKSYIW